MTDAIIQNTPVNKKLFGYVFRRAIHQKEVKVTEKEAGLRKKFDRSWER